MWACKPTPNACTYISTLYLYKYSRSQVASGQPYTWGHLAGVWGAHWPTQCSIVVGNAFFFSACVAPPYLEMQLPNLGVAMGAARCGALATLVAIGTLGAIWVGATRCQWPTKFDTSNQFALFCHGQIAVFLPKKLEMHEIMPGRLTQLCFTHSPILRGHL